MKRNKEAVTSDLDLGWKSGFKLAVCYTLFFSLVMASIFFTGYKIFSNTVRNDELTLVTSQAKEYQSWYINGEVLELEEKMNNQLVKDGDILFVHLRGADFDYANFNTKVDVTSLAEKLHTFDVNEQGIDVNLDGRKWTIVSIPVGKEGIILQAGKYSLSLQNSLSNFRHKFLLIIIPACLISIIGGTFLTYRRLSPLRNLIKTMNEILSSNNLSKRAKREHKKNELNSLVGQFNDLLDRNQNLVTNMRDSLDHIAHDLLTPLSRLRITAERALDDDTDAELLCEALADCVEESEYLEQLLSILLNVTEAKAGTMKLNKKTFTVKSLLEEVCDIYEFVAEEKNISFSVKCSDQLELTADRTRMMQVLANLVDNATKYSGENTNIKLSAKMDDDHVLICVRDQGEGISAENLPHIWNRLYRADQSRGKKGMGLGLSLVKAIIELHGGEIKVESELGKGTEFKLLLPAGASR